MTPIYYYKLFTFHKMYIMDFKLEDPVNLYKILLRKVSNFFSFCGFACGSFYV